MCATRSFVRLAPIAAFLIGLPAAGQPAPCDARLTPAAGSYGYAPREGGRCEGLYRSRISGALDVLSLLRGELRFDLAADRNLVVSAPDVAGVHAGPVHVRAVALPLRTYYRMDAVLPPGASMAWPIGEVLRPAGLDASRLGIFGWVGAGREKVFVPLRVRPQGMPERPPAATPIELRLRSTTDLEVLDWRWVDDDTGVGLPDWQRVIEDRLRAGWPIRLRLPPGEPAILNVEIRAKLPDSDDWLDLDFRIFRPGP